MRKFFLLSLLSFLVFPAFAQQRGEEPLDLQQPLLHRHELSLNLTNMIFLKTPTLNYEYILQEDLGLGVIGHLMLQDEPVLYSKVGVNPYLRWYFNGNSLSTQKIASGFFVEVNSNLAFYGTSDDDNMGRDNTSDSYSSGFNMGLGMGLGWKYVSQNNWVGSIWWSGGRNFFKHGSPAYLISGISIGKRF